MKRRAPVTKEWDALVLDQARSLAVRRHDFFGAPAPQSNEDQAEEVEQNEQAGAQYASQKVLISPIAVCHRQDDGAPESEEDSAHKRDIPRSVAKRCRLVVS